MAPEDRSWWAVRSRLLLAAGAIVLLVVTVASIVLLTGGSDSKEPPAGPSLTEGQVAPAFSLPDAGGKTVSLSDFKGRPVLLYFSMGYG